MMTSTSTPPPTAPPMMAGKLLSTALLDNASGAGTERANDVSASAGTARRRTVDDWKRRVGVGRHWRRDDDREREIGGVGVDDEAGELEHGAQRGATRGDKRQVAGVDERLVARDARAEAHCAAALERQTRAARQVFGDAQQQVVGRLVARARKLPRHVADGVT